MFVFMSAPEKQDLGSTTESVSPQHPSWRLPRESCKAAILAIIVGCPGYETSSLRLLGNRAVVRKACLLFPQHLQTRVSSCRSFTIIAAQSLVPTQSFPRSSHPKWLEAITHLVESMGFLLFTTRKDGRPNQLEVGSPVQLSNTSLAIPKVPTQDHFQTPLNSTLTDSYRLFGPWR